MFVTAVKIAIVEAINAGFDALGPRVSSTTKDLTPNSVTIEYPMVEVAWPSVFVQFRPTKVQWSGLDPDTFTTVSGTSTGIFNRTGYFEGNIDLQILAMHSEERDRLWDSLYNLVLMNPGSPASAAFYDSLANNDLLGITLLPSIVGSLGDTVAMGTPFSPEELTYEASIRIPCVGDFYEGKYDFTVSTITEVTASGQLTELGVVYSTPSMTAIVTS